MCIVQLQTVALQYSDESAKFAAATKNSETKDAPETLSTKIDAVIGQFDEKTRIPC
jgi:hypothetical protein